MGFANVRAGTRVRDARPPRRAHLARDAAFAEPPRHELVHIHLAAAVGVHFLRGGLQAARVTSVLEYSGKTMRDAVRNKKRWRRCRTRIQYPSTDLQLLVAELDAHQRAWGRSHGRRRQIGGLGRGHLSRGLVELYPIS